MKKKCDCYYKDRCEREKMVCERCGKETEKLNRVNACGYCMGTCFCQECYDDFQDMEAREDWKYHTLLLGTEEIHCIKCSQELTYKDTTGLHTDEYKVSFKCPKCKFTFTLYHGEAGDCRDYEEEQEWKEYSRRMKKWKENNKKGPKPTDPEQQRIDDYHLRKYGEY